ncbi:hypothetical protein VSWAT3_25479 [Vibrionales bacterium SWAT-3]|nr:hypothetical protein VSWAT3_25479 [Vibrionales bacterium SWAT-3]
MLFRAAYHNSSKRSRYFLLSLVHMSTESQNQKSRLSIATQTAF